MTEPHEIPPYPVPGATVYASYHASDGSAPQEIRVEWKHDPGPATLAEMVDRLATVSANSRITVESPPDNVLPFNVKDVPDRDSVDVADTVTFPRPFCTAELVVGPDHTHRCGDYVGHPPSEPDGRGHRCTCGGLFSADLEVIDVPGSADLRARRKETRR
jgi:hypothetical protein